MSDSDEQHPVNIVPAPWALVADSWIFPFWNSSTSSGLPSGSYHPMESIEETKGETKFRGGPGGWLLYRYSESPVGPYDELVAGIFDSPDIAKGLRITNIYVSSEESVYNGRRNWNIPKHKARFEWSHGIHTNSSESQSVSIYHPQGSNSLDTQAPFFSALLRPSPYCPNIPLNTTYSFLPSLYLYQPALLASKYEKGTRQSQIAAHTNEFVGVAPTFAGSFHLAFLSPVSANKEFGDGISFPRLPAGPYGVGFHFSSVKVGFPEPIHLTNATMKKKI